MYSYLPSNGVGALVGKGVEGGGVGAGVVGAAVVGDGVGAAVPKQALPPWFTQITASPVDVLIDSTVTVISTPLIFSDQLPPAFSLARSVDCAPPVHSLPARVIKTSTFGRRNDGKG